MTKNDLLAEIVKTYHEIEDQLMVIGTTMENVLNKTNNKNNFTAQRFCADFDIILQHTLIEIAVADNNLAPEELATAEGVTTYGDIMLLSKSAGMDITWKDFYKMNLMTITKWLEAMRNPIRRVTTEFIAGFAAVDAAVKDHDLLDDFIKKVSYLFSAFTNLEDGKLDEFEKAAIGNSELMFAIKNINLLIKKNEN